MSRPALEVADIFRGHGPAWRRANAGHVSLGQLKVMSAIENCRTAALGGHVARCEDCSHTQIAYNSCRNRHCHRRRSLRAFGGQQLKYRIRRAQIPIARAAPPRVPPARFPPLEAFGRRPAACAAPSLIGPASETLHSRGTAHALHLLSLSAAQRTWPDLALARPGRECPRADLDCKWRPPLISFSVTPDWSLVRFYLTAQNDGRIAKTFEGTSNKTILGQNGQLP
jgi:hypothetical protein